MQAIRLAQSLHTNNEATSFYHFVKNNLTRFQSVKKSLFERRFSIWKIFFNTRWNCNRKVPFLGGITLCSFYPELWLGIPNGDVQRSAILAILLVQFAFLPSTTSSQKFCGEWLFSKEYQNPFQQFVQKILPLNRWNPKSYFFKVPFPQKKNFWTYIFFFETIESIGNLDEIWVLWRNQSQNFSSQWSTRLMSSPSSITTLGDEELLESFMEEAPTQNRSVKHRVPGN